MYRTIAGFVALALVSLGRPAPAQEAETPSTSSGLVDWQPDFDKALTQAKKEKRPLMVAFILQGESANEELCDAHLRDERIVAMSRRFVCLLALATYGPQEGVSTAASERLLRDLEGRVSLKQLIEVEHEARYAYMESNQVSAPQFLFVRPDGETMLLQHVWMLTADELLFKMQKAYHFFDPSFELPEQVAEVTKKEAVEVTDLLERCRSNNMNSRREAMYELAAKDHPDVVEFLIAQSGRGVDLQKRLEAVRAMARTGAVKFLPALHRLLAKETKFQLRSNIADTLGTIGLVESVPHLAKVLAKESKDNLRSLLLRALEACGPTAPETEKALATALGRGSNVDQLTALCILAERKAFASDLEPSLVKCLKTNNDGVRAAAYWVVGRHGLDSHAKQLRSRLSTEKGLSRQSCAWAFAKVGGDPGESVEEPVNEIRFLLPSASW